MLHGAEIRPDMTMQIAWGQDGWPTSFAVEVDDGNEVEVRRYVQESAPAAMGNVTDDERRRVAAALRDVDSANVAFGCTFARAVGFVPERCQTMADCRKCKRGMLDRLADLIESNCDREGLLALADELHESLSWIEAFDDGRISVPLRNLIAIERCIREACGEVEQGPLGRHHAL